jgi:hypothetical protein
MWKTEHEHLFFTLPMERGVAAAGDVLDTCGFPPTVPAFLRKRRSIIKRTVQLRSGQSQKQRQKGEAARGRLGRVIGSSTY